MGKTVTNFLNFPINSVFTAPNGVTEVLVHPYFDNSRVIGIAGVVTSTPTVMAIRYDGTLWGFGLNTSGQLGSGAITNQSSAVQITAIGSTYVQISSPCAASTLTLRSDGTLWATGANTSGAVGDGTATARSTFTQIGATLGTFVQIAQGCTTVAAGINRAAIRNDGTLWCWGNNAKGNLGDGTILARSTPTQVGTTNTWTQVVTSAYSTTALDVNGNVWATGYNTYGKLGDNTTATRSTFTQVVGTTGLRFKQIASGALYTLGLTTANQVYCWGGIAGTQGLFTGNTAITPAQMSTPVNITSLIPTTNQIVGLGANGSIDSATFLDSTGTIWAVGNNTVGELGDGTTTNRTTPVAISGGPWVTVLTGSVNNGLTVGVDNKGQVWGWGTIAGDNTITPRSTPTQVIATGGGNLFCGYQMPSGIRPFSVVPGKQYKVSVGAKAGVMDLPNLFASNVNVTAFLRQNGTVWTTGLATGGELGTNSATSLSSPVQITSPAGFPQIASITAFGLTVAALGVDGSVWGWGYNTYGQITDGTVANRSTPIKIFSAQVAGGFMASGLPKMSNLTPPLGFLTSSGQLYAWGQNNFGQVGDGTTTTRSTPTLISNPGTGFRQVAFGGASSTLAWSVGLRYDGTVLGWGYNSYGQVGDGTATNRSTPTLVQGMSYFVDIATGGEHALALRKDGTIWGWGYNRQGQLGQNNTNSVSTPVQVLNLSNVTQIVAGLDASFALRNDGTVWFWGNGPSNPVNNTVSVSTPIQVTTLTGSYVYIGKGTIGFTGSIQGIWALKSDGTVWTFGYNGSGTFGNATKTGASTPIQIANAVNMGLNTPNPIPPMWGQATNQFSFIGISWFE